LEVLGNTGSLTDGLAVKLLHVWAFDELDEAEGETVTEEGEEENGFAPSDDGCSPDASEADGTLWVVEEAINPAVIEFWCFVEEEIPKEPAKFAEAVTVLATNDDTRTRILTIHRSPKWSRPAARSMQRR
jgi:hypothetical protein